MHNKLINWFLCLLLLTICSEAFPQKKRKIQIVNADVLEFDSSEQKGAKRLIGNVAFKQDDVLMYCDSAYFFSKTNSLEAYNNVKILNGDSLTLTGDTLYYNGDTKFAKLRGNITLDETKITLKTQFLDYNIEKDLAYYYAGGEVYNKLNKSTLTSNQGYYYPDNDLFFFKREVVLVHPDYTITCDTLKYSSVNETAFFMGPTNILKDSTTIYCERGLYDSEKGISHFVQNASITDKEQIIKADSIFYNQDSRYAKLFESVEIIDTTEKITISGNYSLFNENDSLLSYVTDSALMVQRFDDDTFNLHADTLFIANDSLENREITAYFKVQFYKNDMQGRCDSMAFSQADSTIKLFSSPILWTDENQMTADTITIFQYDGEIKRFNLRNNSFITSQADSGKYNQIKGKNMIGSFKNNELQKINVLNNGQTVYYAKNEDEDGYIGVNKAVCSNMIIYVDSSQVDRITFLSQPTATLFPLNKVEAKDLILTGFYWKEYLKPKSELDIFYWKEEQK